MGPNHFTLKDGGAVCGLCQAKNPLGNLRKLSIQEARPRQRSSSASRNPGQASHALHLDCKTVLGPWITLRQGNTRQRSDRPGRDRCAGGKSPTIDGCMGARKHSYQAAAGTKRTCSGSITASSELVCPDLIDGPILFATNRDDTPLGVRFTVP